MHRRAWLLLAVLASLWGASYLFIKIALTDLSPAMVVFGRTALAALVLVPIALARRALRGLGGRIGPLVVLALVQVAGPFLLIAIGEQWIASGLTGVLVASAPIFTALLAIRFDPDERPRGWGVAGTVAGIAGVGLLLGVDLSAEALALAGGLLVLLAGLGYAAGGLYLKRRLADVPPVGGAAVAMAASALATLPLAAVQAPATAPALGPVAAVGVLGVAGTGLAFLIFYTLIAEVGPGRAALVAYLAPGFAVAYGVLLLGERLSVATLAGLALIVGGSWVAAEGRLPGRRRRAAPIAEPVAGSLPRS